MWAVILILCYMHGILAPAGILVNLVHTFMTHISHHVKSSSSGWALFAAQCVSQPSGNACPHLFLALRLHVLNHTNNSPLGRSESCQNHVPSANISEMLLAGSKCRAICSHNSTGILATADGWLALTAGM
jgi:hypothetical protein